MEGYGSKLMVGRFPLAVISIEIDPYLADVNVHPTKQEVRISKEKELMTLIREAISQALKEQDLIPDALENLAQSSTRPKVKAEQCTLPLREPKIYYDTIKQDFFLKPDVVAEDVKPLEEDRQEIVESLVENKPTSVQFAERQSVESEDQEHPNLSAKELTKLADKLDREETSTFPELEYFGQMHGTYLFAQGKTGLYIIDQHAAQERVKYEYYREKIGQVDNSAQQLLVPYILNFRRMMPLTLSTKWMPFVKLVSTWKNMELINLFCVNILFG